MPPLAAQTLLANPPTQHVQFGVDMSGPFPFPILLLNTTTAAPFYTVRAGFTGACGGWMSWIWPGIAGKCTNLDAFGGTLTNAAAHCRGPGDLREIAAPSWRRCAFCKNGDGAISLWGEAGMWHDYSVCLDLALVGFARFSGKPHTHEAP